MNWSLQERQDRIASVIDSLRPLVEDIAMCLYKNPEIGLKEVYASDKLTSLLREQGFKVERGAAGMPTAFMASVGTARPAFAFMAEYDALPGVGHGCGHNLIASAAILAALACKEALPPEKHNVSWIVAGTPAEESFGGKVAMADAGVFDEIDAALLAHPGMRNGLGGTSWASHPIEFTFHGRTSHAGGNPQDGINALDACVHAYTMIRNLRNQLRDDVRVAGIITHGGDAQNIIPEMARMRFTVRSKEWRYIESTLIPRIKKCAQAAAEANLATVDWHHHESLFKECLEHPVLKGLAAKYFAALGEEVLPPPDGTGGGTTDVGAVSWVCPTIQIGYKITDARGHSRDMADASITPHAIDKTLKAAKLLAFSASELLHEPEMLAEAKRFMDARKQG